MAGLMARLKLPLFNIADPITSDSGRPTITFHRWINNVVGSIQSNVNNLSQLVEDIAFSLKQAGIAIQTANEAKAAAMATAKDAALVNSYVSPSNVLSAALSGSTATITIANHSRIYGDGVTVAVNGGSITGLALSTDYYVTYQDAAHVGGTVSYTATTDYLAAGQGGSRHLVGSITTPASGSTSPSEGQPTRPPGVQPPRPTGTDIQ